MTHNVHTHGNNQTESLDSELKDKKVIEMTTKNHDDNGAAAFKQVMSQMNISDRSAFDEHFEQQWEEASSDKSLLSVLICEIDYFKEYHEHYGPQGASFMLLVIALALKNTCEKQGYFLAHYDKEEFAILIKGGDQQHISEIAESLRHSVESSNTEHKYSKISEIVTLSIGISSMYPKSMRMLMKETNDALLSAQTSGRNQVSGIFPEQEKANQDTKEEVLTSDEVTPTAEMSEKTPTEPDQAMNFKIDELPVPEPEKKITFDADDDSPVEKE